MTTFDLGTMIDDIIETPARLQAERDLRMAAENEVRQLRARVAELSTALDAALKDRYFYWQMYTEQAHELARLKMELTR